MTEDLNKEEITLSKCFEQKWINGSLEINLYFDVDQISKWKIESINRDMYTFQIRGFGNEVFFDGKDLIVSEFNITETPFAELRKKLKKYGVKDWQVKFRQFGSKERVAVIFADIAKNKDFIIKILKAFGWRNTRFSEPIIIKNVQCKVAEFCLISEEQIGKK